MKLIADGGSTKTDWRLIVDDEDTLEIQSGGMNPFHMSTEEIDQVLNDIMMPVCNAHISEIWYYGAGITGERASSIMTDALKKRFGNCQVFVGDDMLGAARALLGKGEGIACVLGTGSNSCYYSKGEVIQKIPPLGYILGDEGSGTDIGKRFINGLFKKSFPDELTSQIIQEENLEMTDVIEKVYRGELPARYLAAYTKIVTKYMEYEAVERIVIDAFDSFIDNNILKYEGFRELEIGFIGSIAVHFKPVLEKVLKKRDLKMGSILAAPIEELAIYHK